MTTETQKVYRVSFRYDDSFNGTTWATLDGAEEETERLYRALRRLHEYVQLDWAFNPAVRWWQLLRDGRYTGYYVEEVEVSGATFAKLDVDALVARIMAVTYVTDDEFAAALREIIGGM